MPHQLLSQEIQPSEHTTGEKLILLHTAITSKGCFQIPRMELQLHSSIFITFLLMKHWKFLLTILIYIVFKSQVFLSINTNKEEITTLIRIQIMMGIIQLLNYRAYWSKNTQISQIADKTPVNRFEKLRQYLHFVDNNLGNTKNDKLFKGKPTFDVVRAECIRIEPEEYLSLDEQIIT